MEKEHGKKTWKKNVEKEQDADRIELLFVGYRFSVTVYIKLHFMFDFRCCRSSMEIMIKELNKYIIY